ncbi:hypothetical protein PACG_01353 [Pseudomonas aeruginosa C3719]|nr:hypothetical protein PACG_01353 [Pseudomonas aeruginosa C3719]
MIVRTLLIAAALLGGTAQAAESTDLCGANLQKPGRYPRRARARPQSPVRGSPRSRNFQAQGQAGTRPAATQGLHHRHHPGPADPAERREEMIRDRRKADNRKRLSALPQCNPPQGE